MQRKIIALVDDMIFAAKIRGASESLDVSVHFARSINAVVDMTTKETTSLIIVDLHVGYCDPFELAQRLKADVQLKTIQLLGFFSHVRTDVQAKATKANEAGYDRILPRSSFSKNLPQILEGRF